FRNPGPGAARPASQHRRLIAGGSALPRARAMLVGERMALTSLRQGARAIRTLGTGLIIQALLSGANFAVGLILIRRTSDLQYSYYILATNALLLVTALQTSFVQPYIVSNLTSLEAVARHELVGALIRTNRYWVTLICGAAIGVTAALWAGHRLGTELALLVAVCLMVAGMALTREFFRITLF